MGGDHSLSRTWYALWLLRFWEHQFDNCTMDDQLASSNRCCIKMHSLYS